VARRPIGASAVVSVYHRSVMLPRRYAPLLLVASLAGACSSSSDESSPGTESDAGLDAPTEGATLSGRVLDVDGAPVPAALGLCADACWIAFTDDAGEFLYQGLTEGHYKLDVRAKPEAGDAFSALSFPLDLAKDEALVLSEPLVLPETAGGTLIGPGEQQVQVDDQLNLTIDGAELVLPLGLTEGTLAGVRVAPEHWPPNELPQGTVHAMWALNPFSTTSNVPMGVEIQNDLGLAADEAVRFHTIDEQTGLVELEAAGQVSGDALTLATSAGEGLSRITWLIVASSP